LEHQKEAIMNAIRDANSGRSWRNPRELIEHIVAGYHDTIRLTLPDLEQLTDVIGRQDGVPLAVRERLESELTELTDLLERHVAEQEGWVFPLIRHIKDVTDETEWDYVVGDSLHWLMDRAGNEDAELLDRAEQVAVLLRDVAVSRTDSIVPDLIERVQVLCRDLPNHAHLEAQVLFPWVEELIKEEGLVCNELW
jgi:iron-sulfur cluster repair protein YtfE (RIC family)